VPLFAGQKILQQLHERSFATSYRTREHNTFVEVQALFIRIDFVFNDPYQQFKDQGMVFRLNAKMTTKELFAFVLHFD